MSLSEDWEMNGQSADVFIEDLQCKAKEHIKEMDRLAGDLNKVVRSSRDWRRNVFISLCSDCRRKHYLNDTEVKQPGKQNEKRAFSLFSTGSGKTADKGKKKGSSVDLSGYLSAVEKDRLLEDFEYVLKAKASAYENSIQRTQSENENLKKEIAKLKEENQTLRSKESTAVCDVKQTHEEGTRVIADLKEDQTAEMTSRLEEFEANEKELEEEITDLKNQLIEKDRKIVELENDLGTRLKEFEASKKESKEQITSLINQLIEKGRKIEELENDLEQHEAELQTVKNRYCELDTGTKELRCQNENIRKRLNDSEAKVSQANEELENTRTENECLKKEKNEQEESFRFQIEVLRQRKPVVIGLRSEKSGLDKPLIDKVQTELTRRLQQKLDGFSVNVTISISQTPSDVTNGIQFILCHKIFGTGTSIADALKGINGDRDTFLMVLHLTTERNISSIVPTSLHETRGKVIQLGGILNMACSKPRGLYDCGFNNKAVDKIAAIIRKLVVL